MRLPFKAYTNISLCFKVSQAFRTFTLLLRLIALRHLHAQACVHLRCPIVTPQPTWLCSSSCFPPADCPRGPRPPPHPVLITKAREACPFLMQEDLSLRVKPALRICSSSA